jgi:fructose-specific PTS system IIA-like component
MPVEFTFTCPLSAGIHARPASCIEEIARQYLSSVVLTNARTGAVADAKSVLLMVGADIRHGDTCRVCVDGPDGNVALASPMHLVAAPRIAPGSQNQGIGLRDGI